ncbi:threonine/serine ThrE exporter family protein [Agromyces binzhouensis]|uniref:Threonine/serine exporter family protein n=1 Tax=Agromyces binzhouensis TaxID=1817495 RepID=A0A4V1QSW6_9MICO|nr:threonine/serine exporter family protein [Agromyces binzhouensis]RXZ49823.1 threonine/serine exporter family protein [Agromyces binzhouensis]
MPTTPTTPPPPEPSETERPPADRALIRTFLLGLAEGLTASAESTDRIRAEIIDIARAYGVDEVDVVVLPTIAFVQTGQGETGRISLTSVRASFRFDQIAAMAALARSARSAGISPADGIRRLNEIGAMPPTRHWFMRTLGHALLTAGLVLLLAPSWQAAVLGFGLGALIGVAKLTRSQTLSLVLPVAASFACAVIVFLLAPVVQIGDPLRVLIAPLATFLPGALLTTGVRELAAGQMVAGTSRLGAGVVQLALLAFGILAAGTVVGIGDDEYVPREVQQTLPWWIAGIGLVLYGIGVYLHFAAPGRSYGWVILALVVAYGAQQLGAVLLGAPVSGFFGALVVTPLVLWIEDLPRGVPSQIAFLPAFWVLVPGAAGLIGLTEGAVEESAGIDDVAAAFVTVMSIALGVFIGSAIYRFIRRSAAGIAEFHVDLPSVLGPGEDSVLSRITDAAPKPPRRDTDAAPKPPRRDPDA